MDIIFMGTPEFALPKRGVVNVVAEIPRVSVGETQVDGVGSVAAIQVILPGTPDDGIVAAFAIPDVTVIAAIQNVVAVPAVEVITAALADEMVRR